MTNTAERRTAALNQLTAACEAAAPALHAWGDGLPYDVARLYDAICTYRRVRTDTDAARDLFLSKFPTAEVMQDELDRRQTERPAS